MEFEFNSSPEPTLGVEIELQLVDRETRALTSAAAELIDSSGEVSWLKEELLQSTIEINSDVCADIAEAEADLGAKLEQVRESARQRGLALISAGTHPFSRWEDQEVSQDVRYHRLVDKVQWPARRMLIFGLHVHVGVPDAESAIQIINHLEPWLPHLLALSASSPFWEGKDTGLASCRSKIFETLPTAGLPYRHENWKEFEQLVGALIRSEGIESIREVWWDVRPHPGFGTVEVRVCDAMPTMGENLAVAALVQALIVFLQGQNNEGVTLPILHPRIVTENKWRAARYSMEGTTIVDGDGAQRPIAETMERLLEDLAPVFDRLGSAAQVPLLQRMVRGPSSYARQRRVFEKTGDTSAVVDALILEGESGQPTEA
ncbi:MAG: glutamate--cysteine ligase [Planctomycetota bacterium]|nr:glutamate--cysteine ligase [Planctomycetota bacterium]